MKDIRHIFHRHQWQICFSVVFIILSLSAQVVWGGTVTSAANLPSYYSGINGKSGSTLWSAVHTVAGTGYSTSVSYNNVWTVYATTDSYMDGSTRKIYDMYGGCDFTYGASSSGGDQCGNYSGECDCYNREHSIPKSWFGGSESANTPGSDVFHLVPTDGKINNTRSNYAFGEVATASTTHNTNGMVNKLGTAKSITIENTMMGTSATKSCSSSPVFEPDDIYKGDFARGYFGTLLKWAGDYQAFTTGDGASMFSGTYTEAGHWGLTEYGIALLLKWHRQDPVSQKEIDRNNGIQQTQGNRNPFIDYPILAEYIWGKYAGQTFSLDNAVGSFESGFVPDESDGDKATGPTITVSTTSLAITSAANSSNTATFTITGANLTGSISIAKSGTNSGLFTISPTSIASGSVNSTNTITVTYSPTATGSHTATLTISSTGATSKTVTLNGTCAATKTVTWKVNGSNYTTGSPTTQVTSGSKVSTLPSNPAVPSACGEKVFVGWTATAINSETDTEPTDLFLTAEESPTITANTTFYAVFATAGSGGSSSGTKTFTFSSIASANNWSNGTAYTTVEDAPVTLTANGGGNNGKYYTSDTSWRMYSGGSVSISVADGSVTSVSSTPSKTFTISNGTATLSLSETVKFTVISVNYTASGGTSYSGYITTCSGASVTYSTVTFHKNDGTSTTTTQQEEQGTTTNLTSNPWSRNHYTFLGWSASSTATSATYSDGASYTFSTDADLYAVWEQEAQLTVTWHYSGGSTPVNYYSGDALALPSTPSACDNGRVFKGWTTSSTYSGDGTDLMTSASGTVTANADYYAVYATASGGGGSTSTVTDNLTNSNTINATTTNYSSWTATDTSDAEYAGQSAGGSGTIQLRSNNNNSGVVTTASGGTATKVALTWNSSTASGRTINVYGKTSAYSAPSDLYDSNTYGTSLGTIVYGTSTELDIEGDYTYIGLRSNSGALYLDNIAIDWSVTTGGSTTTYTDFGTSCSTTTYTITWNANGGSCATSETEVTAGSEIGTLPQATKDGYTFNGWYTASTGGTKIATTTVPTGDAEYFAQYTANTYTITYDKGANGTGTVTSTTQTHGEVATLSSNTFSREGYTQDGWSTTDGGDKAYNLGGSYSANATITLYPHWSALPTYTATFKVGTENYATFEGWTGKSISGISTPSACDGYTFVGWSTQQYGTSNTSAPSIDYTGLVPAANTTYYAVFSTSGVAVGTVLWAENFAHFGTSTPSAAGTGTGTTIYGGATISYNQTSANTKAYNETSAGGTAPELLLYKDNNATWTISGIKMANASAMSLTFLSNRTTFSVTTSSDALTVNGSGKSWTITLTGETAPETFNIIITNTSTSSNARVDNVVLSVTAIDSNGAVFTTAKEFTLTVQSPDNAKGTVGIE